MKKYILLFVMLYANSIINAQVTDADGCKDHPLFNRLPNTMINECAKNFDLVDIVMSAEKTESLEGNKTYITYGYDYDSKVEPPSFYQIVKNYENAIVSKGGKKIYYAGPNDGGVATFKLKAGGKDVWVELQDFGGIGAGQYALTVLEMDAMVQEITANEMLETLNKDGFLALYINFETGKSAILPESQKIIDQLTAMLKSNPALKISIEGHTDNAGTPQGNKVLSESRAASVMNALIAKGIDKSKLSAKGFGQDKPVADNRTEEGRAKNRRVEIIKL